MDLVPTTVLLDHERELKYDYDAIEALSSLPLQRRGNRSPIELWQHANGLDVNAMALMVWAGNKHQDRRWTIDDAQRVIRAALRDGRTTYRQLNEVLNAAINQSGMLGLFQPDDVEGANPTPPTMMTPARAGDSEPRAE